MPSDFTDSSIPPILFDNLFLMYYFMEKKFACVEFSNEDKIMTKRECLNLPFLRFIKYSRKLQTSVVPFGVIVVHSVQSNVSAGISCNTYKERGRRQKPFGDALTWFS